jgi:hypothetical protein
MRDPYKIMVWGPGSLGLVAIWEILQSPAFELVGVRAYSDSKEGIDVGDLIGIDPVGIRATTNLQSLAAIECDCIIYTARDVGTFHTDDEILMLLASGRNVITPLPYQNAHLFRDKAFLKKLEMACQTGSSVFHAPGVDPDLISERVLLSLTGACTDIRYLNLREFWDCDPLDPSLLEVIGFGKSVEEAHASPMAAAVAVNFLKSVSYTTEHILGVKYDRVEAKHDYFTTPKDIDGKIFVKAGTVGRLTHRYECYVDARGAKPFFSMEYNLIMNDDMLPDDVQPDQNWIAIIEGRPSLKMAIDIKASMETGEKYYNIGNLKTLPGNHATIAPCLQTVPFVVNAAPGLLPSRGPSLHWMEDIRAFENR